MTRLKLLLKQRFEAAGRMRGSFAALKDDDEKQATTRARSRSFTAFRMTIL